MTDPNYTHLAILLDQSSAMSGRKESVPGHLQWLKSQSTSAHTSVSVASFDSEYQTVAHFAGFSALDDIRLTIGGPPAYFDAVGQFLNETGQALSEMDEADRPGSVIVAIVSAGSDDGSTRFSGEQVRAMINHQEQIYSWRFIFLN